MPQQHSHKYGNDFPDIGTKQETNDFFDVCIDGSAFPDGIPACTSQRDAWKLALTAQKNGAYAAAFEPLTRSAARADILNEYETAAAQPAAVAKQLGRLVKHRLQK